VCRRVPSGLAQTDVWVSRLRWRARRKPSNNRAGTHRNSVPGSGTPPPLPPVKPLPASSVVDGGGNICVPDSTPGFPLRCIPPTPPSGGYYAISAFPATPVVVAPGSLIIVIFGANRGVAGDYIGLAAAGSDDQHFLNVQVTGGLTSNALIFTAPAHPGQYELRYVKAGAAGHAAVSNPVTVGL
jgi:hypothetical protein